MKACLAIVTLVSAIALAQGQPPPDVPYKLDPARSKALENALRGFKFRDSIPVQPAETVVRADGNCSIPLLKAAVDPEIDRGMLHAAPKTSHMPVARGLPPCKSGK